MARLAAGACALLLLSLAGCGTESRQNKNRPPIPLNVGVSVQPNKLQISPSKFGAGPTSLTITNQSGDRVTVKITGQGVSKLQGPIPSGTNQRLQVVLNAGEYKVTAVGDPTIAPTQLLVTAQRPTSQNDLLLP